MRLVITASNGIERDIMDKTREQEKKWDDMTIEEKWPELKLMLYKMAKRMGRKGENLDELVNEVFVFQNGYIMTCPKWQVFSCARWAILNYHAKEDGGDGVLNQLLARAKGSEVLESQEFILPEDEGTDEEAMEIIKECVKYLKNPLKKTIHSLYWECKTLKEVGEDMGVTHQCVSLRHQKALDEIFVMLLKRKQSQ